MVSAPLDCPSAKCNAGVRLLGIIRRDGTVAFLHKTMAVDTHFVKLATQGRAAEQRFRFADTCAEGACSQWTGTRCGVADKAIERLAPFEKEADVPACGLRPSCRWYRQNGMEACAVCALVVTEVV